MLRSLRLRRVPIQINWLAGLSVTTLLVKTLALNQIPEPVFGMHSLGVVAEGVLGSIVASYVFYIIVVHLKEQSDRDTVMPHVQTWARVIVRECNIQVSDISKKTGVHFDLATITSEQIGEAFKRIQPNSDAPLFLTQTKFANWLQYFNYYRLVSQKYSSKIMSQITFLDSGLVALVTKVDDCRHFGISEIGANGRVENEDMTVFSETFLEYCIACRQLNDHFDDIGFPDDAVSQETPSK